MRNVRGIGGACRPIGQARIDLVKDGEELKGVTLTVLPEEAMVGEDILIGKDILKRGFTAVVSDNDSWLIRTEELESLTDALPERISVRLKLRKEVKLDPRSASLVSTEPTGEEKGMILLNQDDYGALYVGRKEDLMIPLVNLKNDTLTLKEGEVVARGEIIKEAELFRLKRNSPAMEQLTTGPERRREPVQLGDIQVAEITPTQWVHRLVEVLNDFRDVMATSMKNLGRTNIAEFDLEEMEGSRPVRSKPIRLSAKEREGLNDIIQQMMEADMIEPSISDYASPVLLVKKPDGSWRMVIDYRKLNAQTVRMNYPLPLIDDVVDSLNNRSIFSSLDLAWGFFQTKRAAHTHDKTCGGEGSIRHTRGAIPTKGDDDGPL